MTAQINVKGNKKFGNINRNKVNQGDVNPRITVLFWTALTKCVA